MLLATEFSCANPSGIISGVLVSANVTAIQKVAPSPDRENYSPISITPILSKVYEKLVFLKLSSFCEKYKFLPAAQFDYSNGLSCTDALLTISHHLQKSLDAGMESHIVQLNFSAAFSREGGWFVIFLILSSILFFGNWFSLYFFHIL